MPTSLPKTSKDQSLDNFAYEPLVLKVLRTSHVWKLQGQLARVQTTSRERCGQTGRSSVSFSITCSHKLADHTRDMSDRYLRTRPHLRSTSSARCRFQTGLDSPKRARSALVTNGWGRSGRGVVTSIVAIFGRNTFAIRLLVVDSMCVVETSDISMHANVANG